MVDKELGPMWAEFDRLGISVKTFSKLLPQTRYPQNPDGNFAMAIGPEMLALLRSLPDGAGEEAFIRAFRSKFGIPQ